MYINTEPEMKARTTEQRIPVIIPKAFPVLMNSSMLAIVRVASEAILKIATATAEPSNSNISETVVDVGKPRALKVLSKITSANITPTNKNITSLKVNISGWNTPLRATSIIPLEVKTPAKIPNAATINITLIDATFEPNDEFRKLMASFDTPTIRSRTASTAKMTMIIVKIGLMM